MISITFEFCYNLASYSMTWALSSGRRGFKFSHSLLFNTTLICQKSYVSRGMISKRKADSLKHTGWFWLHQVRSSRSCSKTTNIPTHWFTWKVWNLMTWWPLLISSTVAKQMCTKKILTLSWPLQKKFSWKAWWERLLKILNIPSRMKSWNPKWQNQWPNYGRATVWRPKRPFMRWKQQIGQIKTTQLLCRITFLGIWRSLNKEYSLWWRKAKTIMLMDIRKLIFAKSVEKKGREVT